MEKELVEWVKNELKEIQIALNDCTGKEKITSYSNFEYHMGRCTALMDILRRKYLTIYLDILADYQDVFDEITVKSDDIYADIKRKYE